MPKKKATGSSCTQIAVIEQDEAEEASQSSLHLNTNASIMTLGTETIHAPTPKPPWISPFSTVQIHDANKLRQTKVTSIQNMAWRLGLEGIGGGGIRGQG
jgi:hypothetical protein